MGYALAVVVAALVACVVLCTWARRRLCARLQDERAGRIAIEARAAALERLAYRNEQILQNAMDGFFVLGADYGFRQVNPAFCRMIGYAADELRGMKMTDLEVPTSVDGPAAAHWRTGLHHFATSHRHKDGHIIQLESCVVVLREGPEKILVGFARDVTERCRAEQALRDSERRYRNLVETSRDLIWTLDLQGHWTFVNNAARDIYGYEPDEMIGRSIVEFVHPDRRERALQILQELAAGKPRLSFDTEHLRKDGSTVYLSVNVVPVHDDRGRVVGCAGTSTDMTQRRLAESRLRAAHARYESLVTRMPLGYIVSAPDQRILDWNAAATTIFGYTAEEALGARLAELLVPASQREAFARSYQSVLDGTACDGAVMLNARKDGGQVRCEWYKTVLPDQDGGIHGVAALVRDVSERERLEAQLRQSQKLESLGVLAGGVAHDFNNLLVGIMANASLAAEQVPPDAPLRRLMEKVVNAGRRATDLTQRMLAYAGRATRDIQLMDLNALVREMAEFAAAGIPKNVALRMGPTPELPLIKADSGQVQQVIMNLLINAAEAIGTQGGEVRVSTWCERLDAGRIAADFADARLEPGDFVGLEVADTGCGMTPEIMGRIFDPFFTTKFTGRGLGLSAILGIVRAHRGAIQVQSEPGKGTTFRVWFPAAGTRARPAAPHTQAGALPRGSTVLVIDDEDEIRDVVEAVLESRGIRVLTAPDGQCGIELFRREKDRIDAVLLDMNMPGMSGEAVFRALLEENPRVKVLLSSGFSEQEAVHRFGDARLAGFVHKPYTASALVEKIGAALTTH